MISFYYENGTKGKSNFKYILKSQLFSKFYDMILSNYLCTFSELKNLPNDFRNLN